MELLSQHEVFEGEPIAICYREDKGGDEVVEKMHDRSLSSRR